jgi:osmotically-inducible protein OsmY
MVRFMQFHMTSLDKINSRRRNSMKTDSEIQASVIHELKWDPSVSHEKIGVAVSEGIVTLSGTVTSYIEKLAAEKAARRMSGVKAIVEKIEVKVPGTFKRDDQEIAHTVLTHFKWNVQVPDDLIQVKVENGWVALSGEVDWDYQRKAAEKCIRGLSGITGIANNIRIKEKQVQPEVIKERIEEALKRKAYREARHLDIQVDGGKVTLDGNVHSFAEMENIWGTTWGTPGVTSIKNNLTIIDTY